MVRIIGLSERLRNTQEHDQFIDSLKAGDLADAVRMLRDVHWSFSEQEEYIRAFHQRDAEANRPRNGIRP